MPGWAAAPAPGSGAPPAFGPPSGGGGATGPGQLAMVVRTRPTDAILVGLGAAALAGLAWWAVVATTERLFVYGAVLVGVIVGQGVLLGDRKGGVVPGLLAPVFTLAALAVAQYFISRSLAISTEGAGDVPLWLGFSTAVDIVRASIDDDKFIVLFWLVSAAVAMVIAAVPSRRPVL